MSDGLGARALPPVTGVVLAAGAGSRMGTPKAGLIVDGRRLVDRAVAVLAAGGCSPVLAVTREPLELDGAAVYVNPRPDRGLRSSLVLAVDAAADASALAVLLVDLPGVTVDGVRAVVASWRPGRIAIGSYGGRRAHPTVMAPELYVRAALALAGPDEGARALLAAHPELVDEVPVTGSADDLDSPADLARWQRTHHR